MIPRAQTQSVVKSALTILLLIMSFISSPADATAASVSAGSVTSGTTVRWEGTGGTVLTIDNDLQGIDTGEVVGQLYLGEQTTYAFLSFGRRDCFGEFCLSGTARAVAPDAAGQFEMVGNLFAGVFDLYVISDGPAELRIDTDILPEAPQVIVADGVFDHEFHAFDWVCETPTCNLRHASTTFDIVDSYALVSAFGRVRQPPGADPFSEPSNSGATACVHAGASYHEPANGCDVITDDPTSLQTSPTTSMFQSTQLNGGGAGRQAFSSHPEPGPAHAGVRVQSTGGVQEVPRFDGYAFMITSRVARPGT